MPRVMDRRLLISLILNHLRTQQNRDGYVSLLKKNYPYAESHPFLMRLFLIRMMEDIINGMTSLKTKLGTIRKEEGMQARHNRM